MFINAQQVAEVREMKEKWVVPPTSSAAAALNCDENIREWVRKEVNQPGFVLVHHHGSDWPDPQTASAPAQEPTLRHRFLDLAQQWEDETSHLSSPNQRMLHPSYKAILGMGQEHKDEVIDLLIQDMRDNRRQWFWALSYLAQANPIKPEDAGRVDKMINAWVRWAETRVRS